MVYFGVVAANIAAADVGAVGSGARSYDRVNAAGVVFVVLLAMGFVVVRCVSVCYAGVRSGAKLVFGSVGCRSVSLSVRLLDMLTFCYSRRCNKDSIGVVAVSVDTVVTPATCAVNTLLLVFILLLIKPLVLDPMGLQKVAGVLEQRAMLMLEQRAEGAVGGGAVSVFDVGAEGAVGGTDRDPPVYVGAAGNVGDRPLL